MAANKENNIFRDGFTDNSYFSIFKNITEDIYNRRPQKDMSEELIFAYSEDTQINASARRDDGKDYLTVNVGTLLYVYVYMKTALSDKDVFFDIGNIELENNNNVFGKFDKDCRQLLFSNGPIDPVRSMMVNYLSMFAIKFIVGHELGHILNGHCDFIKESYAVPEIKMISLYNNGNEIQYALNRRTLEMDADAAAMTASIDNIIELYKSLKKGDFIEFGRMLPDSKYLFKLWGFAINSVFLIFEDVISTQYSRGAFYLPNRARAALAFNAGFNMIDSEIKNRIFVCDDSEQSEIKSSIGDGINYSIIYHNRKYKKEYQYFNSVTSEANYKKFTSEVLTNWDVQLRERLEKYARSPLYNPDTIDYVIKTLMIDDIHDGV